MDIKMNSSTGTPPIWDLLSVDGIVSFITGDEETLQAAQLSAYLNLNSTPQLPGQGTDWIGFFTGGTSFGEVDSQIRNNINNSIATGYYPEYELINNRLSVMMKRG
jgi:hypothetical protein